MRNWKQVATYGTMARRHSLRDMPPSHVTFRFGAFELDTAAYELRRKSRRIRLARQPMDLLLLMLERPRALISRDEIRKRLWNEDVFVDVDASIRTAVLKIRQVLGDSGESPRFVETVTGKGYRFIAPVEVVSNTSSLPTASAARSLVDASRHNLPAELTSFVGREKPLAELRRLLSTSRLLSLTGSGGVGKTRLAIRLVSDLMNEFAGGVWLVDLASLAAPGLIAQAVANIFGVRESPQRSVRDGLVDYLRDRKLLLLFDTCEHLIDGCAELAEALLRAAPALRIVATSREALGVPGETVYRVPSLSVPEPSASGSPKILDDFEATALFVERATAIQPNFAVHRDGTGPIAAICRRLDGIPLAIELAAAQIAFLSPEQIEARLADGFLTTGTRTSVTRHRTLDATVKWSYQLLSESERRLFSRLSVFPAPWTLETAEHVCGGDGIDPAHMLDLLSGLVSKSLVTVASDGHGARRYRLLETVRQFAHARLGEAGAVSDVRDSHFAFFHREFREALHTLSGPNQAACLRRLQIEQENVRAALEWGLSSPALGEKAVELVGALFWFWIKRGLFAEGRQWLERAAAVPAPRVLRARVALGLGHTDYFQGRDATARNDEVLAWGRDEGDTWLVSMALFGQALTKFECGAFEDAAALAVAAREAAGHEVFSPPLLILGNVALVNGEHDRALALFEEAIEGLRLVGEIWGLGILLSLAAGLRILREEFDEARAYASEALSIYSELEDPRGIAWSLDVFAGLIATEGHAAEAARLWGASDGLLATVGGTLVPTIGWIRDRYFEPARAALGERPFEAARAEGRAMQPERAIAIASRRFDLIVGTEHRHQSAPR